MNDSDSLVGLSGVEAARRLAADGANVLPGSAPKSFVRIAVEVLVEPMFLMLLAAGFTYLALGSAAEAAFLLFSVFAVIGLALAQERKTQRALEALRDLSAPRALVIRDGIEVRVAGKDVVRGDLLVLREGDRIAADGVLLHGDVSDARAALAAAGARIRTANLDSGFGRHCHAACRRALARSFARRKSTSPAGGRRSRLARARRCFWRSGSGFIRGWGGWGRGSEVD